MVKSKTTKRTDKQSTGFQKSGNILENLNIDADKYLDLDKYNYISEEVKKKLLKLLNQNSGNSMNLKLILNKFSGEQLISLSNSSLSVLCHSNIENLKLILDNFSYEQLISLPNPSLPFLCQSNTENLKFILNSFSCKQIMSLSNSILLDLCHSNIENPKLILNKFSGEQFISLSNSSLFALCHTNIENLKLILNKFPGEQFISLSNSSLSVLCHSNIENLKLILDNFSYEQLISLSNSSLSALCHSNIENLKLIFNEFKTISIEKTKDIGKILLSNTESLKLILNQFHNNITIEQLIGLSNILSNGNSKNLELILNKFDDIISIGQLYELSDMICCRTNNNLKVLLGENDLNNVSERMRRCCTNLTLDDLIILKNIKFCNLKDILELGIDINLHSYNNNEYGDNLNFLLSWGIHSRIINNLKILKDRGFGDNINNKNKYNEIIRKWPLVVAWAKNSDLQFLRRNDVNTLENINNDIIKDVAKGNGDITEEEKTNYFRKLHLKEYLHSHSSGAGDEITRRDLLKASQSINSIYYISNIRNNRSIEIFEKSYSNLAIQMVLNYLTLDFELSGYDSIMGIINPDGNTKPFRHFDYNVVSNDNGYKIVCYKKKGIIQVELLISNDEINNIYSINGQYLNYGDVNIREIEDTLEYNTNIMIQGINLQENITTEFRNSNIKMILEIYKLCILFLKRLKKNKGKKFNYKNFKIFYLESFGKCTNRNIYQVVEKIFKINYSNKVYSIIRELYANVYGNKTVLPELYKLRNAMEHGNYIIGSPNTILFYDGKNDYRKYNIDYLVFMCNQEYSWFNSF